MSDGHNHSVTVWINELASDDQRVRNAAAEGIWKRYAQQLIALARGRISDSIRKREDELDVVQEMYASFCAGIERYQLRNRDDLHALLVTATINKARNAARRHTRQKRDVHHDVHDGEGIGEASADPGPDDMAILQEELERRLGSLEEPELRRIATLKLAAYTNAEIAREINRSERAVERKLNRIRLIWEHGDRAQGTDDPDDTAHG